MAPVESAYYLSLFLDEVHEKLALIGERLAGLERQPDDHEAIAEVFREIHTFKGNASTVGFDELAELAHAMEAVLDGLRSRALAGTPGLFRLLGRSLEALERRLSELERGEAGALPAGLREELEGLTVGLLRPVVEARPAPWPEPASVMAEGGRLVTVAVTLEPGCLIPSTRAFMVTTALELAHRVVRVTPPPEALEGLEPGGTFEVEVRTAAPPEELQAALGEIGDIAGVTVREHEAEAPAAGLAAGGRIVRVGASKLARLAALAERLLAASQRLDAEAERHGAPALKAGSTEALGLSQELHDALLDLTRTPADLLLNRFPRLVRDLAHELGKEVDLQLAGHEVLLEQRLAEGLGEVLLHLLRNAVDHGLEPPEERQRAGKPRTGTVRLSLQREGEGLRVMLADDGRGLDRTAIAAAAVERGRLTPDEAARLPEDALVPLLFEAGFSTRAAATRVSGRGVGLDAVRRKVEQLGGTLRLEHRPGLGVVFELAFAPPSLRQP